MEMLDHVIYNLVATGIQAIRSETLMKKFNASKSTVSRFVTIIKRYTLYTCGTLH